MIQKFLKILIFENLLHKKHSSKTSPAANQFRSQDTSGPKLLDISGRETLPALELMDKSGPEVFGYFRPRDKSSPETSLAPKCLDKSGPETCPALRQVQPRDKSSHKIALASKQAAQPSTIFAPSQPLLLRSPYQLFYEAQIQAPET